MYTKKANLALNVLKGVFLIYKPPGIHFLNVRQTLILNLCRDLNKMQVRPPYKYVSIEGPTTEEMNVVVRDSYADDPLVVGPRYIPEDFRLAVGNSLCQESSGLLVCGVNAGTKYIHKLRESRLTRFYKLKGILGQARSNDFATGKIVEKSTWKKIKRHHIDKICAAMQAAHQRKMFELCGLDMQSQAVYELAVQGPIRPADPKVPMIYTIRCVDFAPPEFTLEVVCITEDDVYLKSVVSEVGYKLHSTAHCSYMQCSQFGLFNVKDSLLSKNWDLESILHNMSFCNNILSNNPYMLRQHHANLVQQAA